MTPNIELPFGGIDPAPEFGDSKCMLHWPRTRQHELVPPESVLEQRVAAWCVELPSTQGARSGYAPVWNMYGVAVQFLTMLSSEHDVVFGANANAIRSAVCNWPPRDGRGKIIKTTSFDSFLYKSLPKWGYPVGGGTTLGASKRPGPDIRDALIAAMYAAGAPELKEKHRWRNPFRRNHEICGY